MTADYAQTVRDWQARAAGEAAMSGFAILITRHGYQQTDNVAIPPAAQGHGIGAQAAGGLGRPSWYLPPDEAAEQFGVAQQVHVADIMVADADVRSLAHPCRLLLIAEQEAGC